MVRALTFHDVDEIAHVAFLDDQAAVLVLERIHAADDGQDLIHFEILHEVIVEDGVAKEFLGPRVRKRESIRKICFRSMSSGVFIRARTHRQNGSIECSS